MTHQAVLIADDEEAICFALSRAVRRRGLVPLVAADGDRAVELAGSAGIELVAGLLDVRMPRRDGVSAALAILALRPNAALALMTGYGDHPFPAALGTAIRVLWKPFDLSLFSEWLASVTSPGCDSPAASGPTETVVLSCRAGAA